HWSAAPGALPGRVSSGLAWPAPKSEISPILPVLSTLAATFPTNLSARRVTDGYPAAQGIVSGQHLTDGRSAAHSKAGLRLPGYTADYGRSMAAAPAGWRRRPHFAALPFP